LLAHGLGRWASLAGNPGLGTAHACCRGSSRPPAAIAIALLVGMNALGFWAGRRPDQRVPVCSPMIFTMLLFPVSRGSLQNEYEPPDFVE